MILKNYFYIFFISFYSFLVNWFSGNIGLLPIDTFGFFDTGFSILNGKIPIRDYWAYTGITVDYLQSIFFLFFGNKWSSYLLHSSLINVITSLIFFTFLETFKIKKFYSVLYTIAFATLLYPVIGTPYAYLHAFSFSLIGLFLTTIAYLKDKNYIWSIIPVLFLFSFFSMQTPTVYIFFVIFLFVLYCILVEKKLHILRYLIFGIFVSIFIFIIFLTLSKISLKDLIYQYFLFPITIGESRLTSETFAYVRFSDQLNFKRLFGDFKFIHFFLIPVIVSLVFKFKKKSIDKNFIISLLITISSFLFIFNQLMQANQIYIFAIIPVLAAVLHVNLISFKKKKLIYLILLTLIFATIKFHIRYNIDRKFIDIENKDKSISFNASEIHENLSGLNWISAMSETESDRILINKALEVIKKDQSNIMMITHYQFFSTIFNKDYNILNRWYFWDNNSHPTENHKYFDYYRKFATNKFNKENIETIYLLGLNDEFKFENIKNYFVNKCFDEKVISESRFIKLTLRNCTK